jgi:hypothetical protein
MGDRVAFGKRCGFGLPYPGLHVGDESFNSPIMANKYNHS